MVNLFTGTPGSGKSYNATWRIDRCLKQGINVICNYPVKTNWRHKGLFVYLPNEEITVSYLLQFAREHHKPKKESQTFVVFDEASIKFNSRSFNTRDRMQWIEFLSCSRHYGFDVLLITQSDKAIDRQIRGLVEFNYKFRKLASYGLKGWLLVAVLRKKFICIKYWYVIDEKCGTEFFNIKKKIANLYDTFALFERQSLTTSKVGGIS